MDNLNLFLLRKLKKYCNLVASFYKHISKKICIPAPFSSKYCSGKQFAHSDLSSAVKNETESQGTGKSPF